MRANSRMVRIVPPLRWYWMRCILRHWCIAEFYSYKTIDPCNVCFVHTISWISWWSYQSYTCRVCSPTFTYPASISKSLWSLSVDIYQIGGNKTHLSTGFLILIDRSTILLTITNITIILLLRHISGIQTVFLHQFALFLFLASSWMNNFFDT